MQGPNSIAGSKQSTYGGSGGRDSRRGYGGVDDSVGNGFSASSLP